MALTLNNLISKEIFEQYTVLSGFQSMDREIKSVSILETPDFEKYIIDDSIILTTFYPIQNELALAKSLLQSLYEHRTAGIVIKLFRYVEALPESFIQLAEKLQIPIITLNYDANLSLLFNNILSEIQLSEYSSLSLEQSYATIFQSVYERPTSETLMLAVNKIDNIELVIENLETKNINYSSKEVYNYYLKNRNNSKLIQRVDQDIYYVEDVVYGEKPIYKMVFLARQDRRNIIHNMIEVFRLLVIVIYQNKQEQLRRQQAFLLNFVSNPDTITGTNLRAFAHEFQWNIQFPLLILIVTVPIIDSTLYPQITEYIRSVLTTKWNRRIDELRYSILSDQLFFIINIDMTHNIGTLVTSMSQLLQKTFKNKSLRLGYSKPIHQLKDIPKTFQSMQQAMSHLKDSAFSKQLYDENDLTLVNMLRTINSNDIKTLIQEVLIDLTPLNNDENQTLLETLSTYLEEQFNIKRTAERMFVHYNTIRYRLDRLDQIGLLPKQGDNYFKMHLAIHLYSLFI